MEIKKYFRTENKIYETKDFTLVEDKRFGRRYVNQYDFPFIPKNESDNPEELCDEFVWVIPEGEHHIKPKTGDALWYLCCDYKHGHQIYGAIWTNKGLIYAMKMNDTGEWELL